MRFLMDYVKSRDFRSIMRNRNIAEYQKPCIILFLSAAQWLLLQQKFRGGNHKTPHSEISSIIHEIPCSARFLYFLLLIVWLNLQEKYPIDIISSRYYFLKL